MTNQSRSKRYVTTTLERPRAGVETLAIIPSPLASTFTLYEKITKLLIREYRKFRHRDCNVALVFRVPPHELKTRKISRHRLPSNSRKCRLLRRVKNIPTQFRR